MFGLGIPRKNVEESIRQINIAINKEVAFKKYTDQQVMYYVMKEARDVVSFISSYVTEDSLYIHYHKKTLLLEIIKEFGHLVSSCRYYYNYSEYDKVAILKIIGKIQSLFNQYSLYGSLYVFRHCIKEKRTDAKGIAYDGIPTHAIKNQAMKRAKEIIDEILISPKKIRIIFYHSEMKRTKIFAEIIRREIMNHLNHCKDKIEIVNNGYDPRIRYGYFDNNALKELKPFLDQKGEFYTVLAWYFNMEEFKSYKFQPKPEDVIDGINNFVRECQRLTIDGGHYTIVIGITHSWMIDAYLMYKIPGLQNHIKKLIETASFFKVECGEINYLGKWVNL